MIKTGIYKLNSAYSFDLKLLTLLETNSLHWICSEFGASPENRLYPKNSRAMNLQLFYFYFILRAGNTANMSRFAVKIRHCIVKRDCS